MMLREDQIMAILEYPLDEALQDVRRKLRACTAAPPEDVVSNLLGTLILSPAAFYLFSSDRKTTVAHTLCIYGKIFER